MWGFPPRHNGPGAALPQTGSAGIFAQANGCRPYGAMRTVRRSDRGARSRSASGDGG